MAFGTLNFNARLVTHDGDKIIKLRDFAKLTDPLLSIINSAITKLTLTAAL